MAKINNRKIYKNIENPSLLDFLLGTKEESGSTKSFPLQSVIQLINGVNGRNNIQYQFYNGEDIDIDYTTTGMFFTDTNQSSPDQFSTLIFNKETLYPIDLSLLFSKIGDLQNTILKLENPEDPNNFFRFKIVSFQNNEDYFSFGVQPFYDFYIGDLINEKIYSLYFDIQPNVNKNDSFTSVGSISLEGNKVTISTGFEWEINGGIYSNMSAYEETVLLSSAGKQRFVVFVANVFNTFDSISGPESTSNPIAPPIPSNVLQATILLVTDGTISQPEPPVLGSEFVKKSEQSPVVIYGGGGGNLSVDNEKSYFEINSYGSSIISIEDQQGYLYLGKEVTFRNTGNSDLVFEHNPNLSEMNKKFFTFPDEESFVLKPDEILKLKLGSNNRLNYVGFKKPVTTSDIFSKELLTIADLSTNTGFVNTESGIKGGVLGIENCTIQFPAIDYTRKFRIDLVVRVLNATNVNARVEIKKSGNNWQGLSYFEVGAGNITMNKTHLNSQGVSEIPDNSTFQYSLIGNGKRVIRNIFPISAKWDGDYATTYLPPFTGQIISQTEVFNYNPSGTVEMFKGIDEISITGTNTNDIVISSVNVQYFDELEAYDHKSYLATLMDISVLNDAIDDVFPAFLYCPVNSKGLIQWHHPNGYNGTIEKDIYGNIFSELFNDGYAICYGTFNSYNVPAGTALWGAGVTSSNWGSPTGMVYRKALNDYCDALIKADHFIQMGGSMGAFNALSYAARFPSKIRAVVGFSGALDLTYNFNTNFTNTIRKAYGAAYRCIAESTGNNTSNNTFWVKIANETDAPQLEEYGNPFLDTYSSSKSYVPGDVVFENYTGDVAGLAEFDLIANPRTLNKLPILLIHGDSDTLIGDEQSSNFQTAVNNTEGDVKFILIPGADHLDIAVFDYVAVDRFLKRVNLSSDDVLDKSGITNGSMTDALEYLNEEKQNKKTKITTEPNITKTLTATDEHILFTNANAVTFTIPTNASVPIPVGTKVRYTQQGEGVVTVGGAGITFVTNLSLAMVKGETRTLTKIGTDTWTVEGNDRKESTIQGNVIYIAQNGSDTDYILGSKNFPFKTLDAALLASDSNTSYTIFEILDNAKYFLNRTLVASRDYTFVSSHKCTVSLENNTNSVLWRTTQDYFKTLTINIPFGSLILRTATAKAQSIWQHYRIVADYVEVDSTFQFVNPASIIFRSKLLKHNSGVLINGNATVGSAPYIFETEKIEAGTGQIFDTVKVKGAKIYFGSCVATGAYVIANFTLANSIIINHGSYSSSNLSEFFYINFSGSGENIINFIEGAKISGKVSLGGYNGANNTTITGSADFSGVTSSALFVSPNNSGGVLTIVNARLKIPSLFREQSGNGTITIVNSFIEVTGVLYSNDYQNSVITKTNPLITFEGHNVVYCKGSTVDYIRRHPNTGNPYIDIIGTLKTNGIIQSGITINNIIP